MSELKGVEYAKATVKTIGIGETKAGLPSVVVNMVDDQGRDWTWFGSLKEGKAREITISALKVLDFNGKLSDLANGKGIDFTKEFQITIDDETRDDGKTFRRVKWINDLNKGAKLLAEADALLKLSGMGLEADFASAFNKTINAEGANPSTDELPF